MPSDSSRIVADAESASSEPPKLRADARENRSRILDAARDMFAARGLEVPMAAIARRAGVGMATLYRRFPTRATLIAEVFTDQLSGCMAVVDDALADPDPWQGFCFAVQKLCEMQVADRGFTSAFLTEFPGASDFEHKRAHAERGLAELVRRAQASGQLRTDFEPSDLVLLLMANGGIAADSAVDASAASARLIAYLLQSFRAEHAESLPPAVSLTIEQVPRPRP